MRGEKKNANTETTGHLLHDLLPQQMPPLYLCKNRERQKWISQSEPASHKSKGRQCERGTHTGLAQMISIKQEPKSENSSARAFRKREACTTPQATQRNRYFPNCPQERQLKSIPYCQQKKYKVCQRLVNSNNKSCQQAELHHLSNSIHISCQAIPAYPQVCSLQLIPSHYLISHS